MSDPHLVSESPKCPLFESRIGAQIGKNYWWSRWATAPLAKLAVFPDYIAIELIGVTYRFERDNVTGIAAYKTLGIPTGLRMWHSQTGYPPYVVFGALSREQNQAIMNVLHTQGYPVDGDSYS